jgi:hypothetical protein
LEGAFLEKEDKISNENYDEEPEWKKNRIIVNDELENTIERPPYFTNEFFRGQTRGKASIFSKTVQNSLIKTCTLKSYFKIEKKKTN